MSILSKILKKRIKKNGQKNDNFRQQQDPQNPQDLQIFRSYRDNMNHIKKEFGNSTDINSREFAMQDCRGMTVCIDGLANTEMINDFFLESILRETENSSKNGFEQLVELSTGLGTHQLLDNWGQVFELLLSGNTLIFVDGFNQAISVETKGWEKRAISAPDTQLSIRGPKDAFTETLRTNTALIRRRIKSPNLWLESLKIGSVSQTDVALMYIKGIVNDKTVKEVRTRLEEIKIDAIQDSGTIEQLIEDQTWSIFPTVYNTERPDIVSSKLLEGRVAVLIDGSPFVLTAPTVFIEAFHAPDDYYIRFDIATALRFLRVIAFMMALIGPALYIAGTTYHQEMIPTIMVIAIAAQRENVPFPAFVEALIMEIALEILREAGLRLPRAVGQAVSIVGALVIGQAAVQAGIVSALMVIVVSITAIANFSTPSFSVAVSARILRFSMMLLASFLGFYGIMLGILFLTLHLCSLRSFGVPYMSPLAPFNLENQKDSLFRFPIWALQMRPSLISKGNIKRIADNQQPKPPEQTGVQDPPNQGDSK